MNKPAAPDEEPTQQPAECAKAPGGAHHVLQLASAVFWAFFGVRKASAQERDVRNFKPVHVIVAGIVGALIFIGVLIAVVNWVVSSQVASQGG